MLRALDAHARAHHVTEEVELGAAQARARGCRGADRAVVLHEQHSLAVGIVDDLRQIPLVGTHTSERFCTYPQRSPLRHRAGVRGALLLGTPVDDALQSLVAERGTYR